MKKFAIALLASTALAVPAFAAPMNNPPPKQQQSQMQQPSAQQNEQQNRQQAQNSSQQNEEQGQNAQKQNQASYVRPSELNRQQVRKIQMALNKDGFDAGHVDGIWGPHTRNAVRHFDQAKNIQAKGRLTQKTLSDLGVQVASNQNNGNSNQNMKNQAQTPNQAPNATDNGQSQNSK